MNQKGTAYSAEVRKVDPETAERWLTLNKRNRSLNHNTVDRYVHDMETGAWQFTGEAVKFDMNGDLVDGQHRLAAIVKSGCTIECLVIDGIEAKAQDVMDSGRGRTAADALRIRGELNSIHAAAIATIALGVTPNGTFNPNKVTHTAVIDWVEANPDVHDAINMARTNSIPGVTTTTWAYVLLVLRRIDEDQAAAFACDLATYRTDGPGDPRSALLNRLTNAVASREKLTRRDQLMLLLRVWNLVRDGKSLTKLTVIGRDGQPIPIPTPH